MQPRRPDSTQSWSLRICAIVVGDPHPGKHQEDADDEGEPVRQHAMAVVVGRIAALLEAGEISDGRCDPRPGEQSRLSLPATGRRGRNGTTRALSP